MKRREMLTIGAVSIGVALPSLSWAASASSPADIVRRASELDRVNDWSADMKLEMAQPNGDKRVRKGTLFNKQGEVAQDSMRLFRVVFPGDIAGTAVLTHEHKDRSDDTWLYLPALKKVRRIVSSSKRDSFLGSEFSYVDMAKPRVDSYNYQSVDAALVDGVRCHVIEGKPKSDEVFEEEGYGLVRSFVAVDTFQTLKVEYLNAQGQLMKTQRLNQYLLVPGTSDRYIAQRREMVNHQSGQRSTIELASVKINQNLSAQLFKESRLGQD